MEPITCSGYMQFTSSTGVQNYLPAGGPPAALTTVHVNPLTTEAGVLGGQMTALTMSLMFDEMDPSFGQSPTPLADYFIVDPVLPACQGQQVRWVYDQGMLALNGCPDQLTVTEANECVSAINEAYVDGTHMSGRLCSIMV